MHPRGLRRLRFFVYKHKYLPMGFFKKLFSPLVWGNLMAMALVVVVLAFVAWKWIAVYTNHGESVEVPNAVGMLENDARYKLEQMGLSVIATSSGYDKRLPAGSVLEQSPVAGARVKPGRVIYLTTNSDNVPTKPLPDVADNSSLREAQAKLTALGFKLGPVEYIPGDKDWVYGVKSRGHFVYAGEQVPLDVPLILQVGNSDADADELEEWDDSTDVGASDDEMGLDFDFLAE